jgi:hypothetical protein
MSDANLISIRRLGPDTLPLFLRFFDGDAFAENHFGPLVPYLSARFTVHREDTDGSVLVRRDLQRATHP